MVEGPNEAGKSSIAEALRLVLEFPAESNTKEIKAVRPVHRDEAPQIEVEIRAGEYQFALSKTFSRKGETTLTVTKPRPESLVGRDAHNRAMEILRSTVDKDLWDALCVTQGDTTGGLVLPTNSVISIALDKAAGGSQSGESELSLLTLAQKEALKYYSPGGKERAEFAALPEAAEKLNSDLDSLAAKVRATESDSEELLRLNAEIRGTNDAVQRYEQAVQEWRGKWESISAIASAVQKALTEQEVVRGQLAELERQSKERAALTEDIDERAASTLAERSKMGPEEKDLHALSAQLEAARKETEKAIEAAESAQAVETLRQKDLAFVKESFDLVLLEERLENAKEARSELAKADETLATLRVDDKAAKKLQELHTEVEIAARRRAEGGPRANVTAEGDIKLLLNGKPLNLGKGQSHVLNVTDRTRLRVPGQITIEVAPGRGNEELETAQKEAEAKLAKALDGCGIASLDEAVEQNERRRGALSEKAEKKRVLAQSLRDLEFDELTALIAQVEARTKKYRSARAASPPLASSADQALKLQAEAEKRAGELSAAARSGRRRVEELQRQWEDRNRGWTERIVGLQVRERELEGRRNRLQELRAAIDDGLLSRELAEARKRLASKADEISSQQAMFGGENPETVKNRYENAQNVLKKESGRLEKLNLERVAVTTRLEVAQQQGVFELVQAKTSELQRAQAALQSVQRKAAAAKLLLETMEQERQKEQAAYVMPLKKSIDKLGRVIFGGTFEVSLDQQLRVVSRTLHGVTVPFESLSSGTKEQVSILCRLACAILAEGKEGVPVIIDDALGYSDPGRLEKMGAVFDVAARECQIIILTCQPDRYRSIGTATVERLAASTS